MNLENERIAFCGTGQMATALATGFCQQLLRPSQICGFDPYETARQRFQSVVGADSMVSDCINDAIESATVVVIAVKPQVIPILLAAMQPVLQPSQLVVSIAAGVTLQTLEEHLGQQTRLIRIMPNTPCLIGQGACAICPGAAANESDVALIRQLLETVAIVETVPERLMDAVTGLSGSGPAYVYQMIQALSDGGVRMGIPRQAATRLAAQTVAGAAAMVLQSESHPGELTDAVTSPGGTTIAGLHALESGGFHATLMNAVQAATNRSAELGR